MRTSPAFQLLARYVSGMRRRPWDEEPTAAMPGVLAQLLVVLFALGVTVTMLPIVELDSVQVWAFAALGLLAPLSQARVGRRGAVTISDAYFIPACVLLSPPNAIFAISVPVLLTAALVPRRTWVATINYAGSLLASYLVALATVAIAAGQTSNEWMLVVAAFAGARLSEHTLGRLIASLARVPFTFSSGDLPHEVLRLAVEMPAALGVVYLVADHPIIAFSLYAPFVVSALVSRANVDLDRRVELLSRSLSRYLPERMVDTMIKSGQPIELGGAEVEATVLFCDVRGFTSWAEGLPANQVISELNELLGDFANAVFETGGTLDKFTGDGLMAFWGAPMWQPDHAERAAVTAGKMVAALERRNTVRIYLGQPALTVGIGIHTGSAVVGNVGHTNRMDYTAIGDTVNTAARLEAAAKELGATAIVSRATLLKLSGQMQAACRPRGNVLLRGKAEPVEVWELIGMRGHLRELPVPVDPAA